MYYESLMVITKKKPIVYTQMIFKKNQSIPWQLSAHKESKKGRKYETVQKQLTKWQCLYLSVITLNLNSLNSLFKRHRLAHGLKKTKQKTNYMLPMKDSPKLYNTHSERWKIFHLNGNQKRAGIAIL